MPEPSIGQLRWKVTLARRKQVAPAAETGILETYDMLQVVHADIQPLRRGTYWAAMIQTESPVTHLVILRWVDALDNTQAFLRTTRLRSGVDRTEVFRVRRIGERNGRKRFVEVECELERLIE